MRPVLLLVPETCQVFKTWQVFVLLLCQVVSIIVGLNHSGQTEELSFGHAPNDSRLIDRGKGNRNFMPFSDSTENMQEPGGA
jgi:hypothetical protein